MQISQRISTLSESLTIAITAKAKQLREAGVDVISFSAGEPDFDTPQIVKDAVMAAMNKGCAKYTPVPGTNEVLKAVATKLERDNNLKYATSQIITTVGAKHALFNLFQAVLNPGDEVIIPSPYWVSYPEMVKYSGGVSVFVEADDKSGFKITAEQIEKAITPRTKILSLNHPTNPTGAVYTKAELEAIAEVLKGTDIIISSDEMYEKLVFDGEFVSAASISDDMYARTVTINGLSKCGAMPGWRFGYMAIPDESLAKAIKRLQSQSTSNISSLVQAGAVPVLLGEADADIAMMKAEFLKRRNRAVELINKIDGLSVSSPAGAFYLFVNCKDIEPDSMKFCDAMLEKAQVATVPGVGFGMDGYFRMSFATDMNSIETGIARIAEFVRGY
ncbi:pyridoxal phosphate-dependent aminotransferase [Campylobacter sp. 19-13652]|uniref:pyridoxal phosphate-dependent aminotransferase n=1 Tax=Campylobacter sp. 19-13652 TaxID=2840180 RepID=UPI001C74F195|nr:pyridoxal phosphate-dependent aminotransferase [Campylobacter sp. 19-13652]BCX79421.1 aspartate aminotransferase [Campylobacter sp. 19-13652]